MPSNCYFYSELNNFQLSTFWLQEGTHILKSSPGVGRTCTGTGRTGEAIKPGRPGSQWRSPGVWQPTVDIWQINSFFLSLLSLFLSLSVYSRLWKPRNLFEYCLLYFLKMGYICFLERYQVAELHSSSGCPCFRFWCMLLLCKVYFILYRDRLEEHLRHELF